MEYSPNRHKALLGSIYGISSSLTLIFISIYFQLISKEWFWYQCFGLSIAAISALMSLILPESPKFYYEKKRYDEARNVFK
jgi:MFS family permease